MATFMLVDSVSIFNMGMDFMSLFSVLFWSCEKAKHIAYIKVFIRQHLVFLLALGGSSLWSKLNQAKQDKNIKFWAVL